MNMKTIKHYKVGLGYLPNVNVWKYQLCMMQNILFTLAIVNTDSTLAPNFVVFLDIMQMLLDFPD